MIEAIIQVANLTGVIVKVELSSILSMMILFNCSKG